MRSLRLPLLTLVALMCSATIHAQDKTAAGKNTPGAKTGGTTGASGTAGASGTTVTAPLLMATDPSYRLSLGDEISISVHGEDDISTAQRIDKKGAVRIPYVNEVNLADKTVREAESFIEQVLIERKLIKKPLVSITVRDYATNEVTLTGRGIQAGVFPMPREVASIEIVELITRLGGFTPNAEQNKVKVYRKDENGRETIHVVDVEAMMVSKKNALKSFLIYPGDRLFVDERLF